MAYRHKAFKSPSKSFIRKTSYVAFAGKNSGSFNDFQALQITPCQQKRQPFGAPTERKGGNNDDLNQEISDICINVQQGVDLLDVAEGQAQPQTTAQPSPQPTPELGLHLLGPPETQTHIPDTSSNVVSSPTEMLE